MPPFQKMASKEKIRNLLPSSVKLTGNQKSATILSQLNQQSEIWRVMVKPISEGMIHSEGEGETHE